MTRATPTHCPYCSLQCGMSLAGRAGGVRVSGDPDFPVNRGGLCIKGWTSAVLLDHPERLLAPLARSEAGALVPVSWDEALERTVRGFKEAQAKHGLDGVGVFGGGSLTNEKAYLLGKFARVALGTSNIDYNGRFCMSSAAAASNKAFGIDRGLPFPVSDLAGAEVILLAGSNVAETMPPVMQYFEAQRGAGGQLLVVDPRRSATARGASLHLAIRPGTDAALANGLLHVVIQEGLVDTAYVEGRTEGFGAVRSVVAGYWPERVERITGVPEGDLVRAARALAGARTAMILTARGPEQQAHGVDNTLAYINLALALGLPGRAFSGYGCLTGQGNGQGGREHGQKADQLPGYRRIDDPAARRHIVGVWGVEEDALPGPGRPAFELLESLGTEGGVSALLLIGSNPVVSAPDAGRIRGRLQSLDFLAVSDFFLSETALLADVVFPSAQWAEEEGTMTNLEGRVIRRRRALTPPGEVRSDLDLLCALATRLGKGRYFCFPPVSGSKGDPARPELLPARGAAASLFDEGSLDRAALGDRIAQAMEAEGHPEGGSCENEVEGWSAVEAAVDPEAVFEELRRASAGGLADYSGITYRRIEDEQGVFWPCPDESHPGTPRLFQEVFPTASGQARFHAVHHRGPAEEPDEEYPLRLTTGRIAGHYQSGTQTRRVDELVKAAGAPSVEMHPATVRRYGLVDGEPVVVRTRRGSAVFSLSAVGGIREDTIFVPFHWAGGASANLLTNPALDPISRMPEFKVCAARVEPQRR